MKNKQALRALALAGVAVAALTLAGCGTMLLPPNISPVVTPSRSVAEAEARLAETRASRARVEATYLANEQRCYEKFFVNNCLDKAKEQRRSALAVLTALEVEAERYQRKAAVDARDREVARAVAQYEADEAARAATPAPAPRSVTEAVPKAPKVSLASRRAAQEQKLARRAAAERASAPKRAESARQFEENRLAAEKRQQRVADKLAEKKAKAEAEASAPPGQ